MNKIHKLVASTKLAAKDKLTPKRIAIGIPYLLIVAILVVLLLILIEYYKI